MKKIIITAGAQYVLPLLILIRGKKMVHVLSLDTAFTNVFKTKM